MPFQSRTQQRWMYKNMPKEAAEWASETDFTRLPERANRDEAIKRKLKRMKQR